MTGTLIACALILVSIVLGDWESLSKRLGYQTECRLPTRPDAAVLPEFCVRTMTQRLLIVGGSVRPVLASARRAGFEICAFDFFADWDSRWWTSGAIPETNQKSNCKIQAIRNFEEILSFPNALSCDTALICGGMENQIELVRRIHTQMPILGTPPDQLERLSSGAEVFNAMNSAGFRTPPTKLTLLAEDRKKQWLCKRDRSSSGTGITRIDSAAAAPTCHQDEFFQQQIEGISVSVVYVSASAVGQDCKTSVLGISRQMVGDPIFGAVGFRYCGSVGPIQLTRENRQTVGGIGQFLANEFGIRGVWGIDYIVNSTGIWPVDVNPRITASAELLESNLQTRGGQSAGIVDLQASACQTQLDSQSARSRFNRLEVLREEPPWCEGKAVLFHAGNHPVEISDAVFSKLSAWFEPSFFGSTESGFSIADVPCPGQIIDIGAPLLTLRVRCVDQTQVETMLQQWAMEVFELLGSAPNSQT